jgi:hypothetical protein
MKNGALIGIIVSGFALAGTLTYITSLVWPPPHPFWW